MTRIEPGDRVIKRGTTFAGTAERECRNPAWLVIRWDDGLEARTRPRVCHRNELAFGGRPT